jgi:hypothetical protein
METAIQKAKKVISMTDCERCFASRARQTIIDVLHPVTGRTVCYGKTLEEARREFPDAEEMSVDEFCAWKAEQQRTQITWSPTTEARFNEMLGCLPPAAATPDYNAFLVGEPYDHDAGNGRPRFEAYRLRNGVYETASRPITRAEFHAEMTNAGSERAQP